MAVTVALVRLKRGVVGETRRCVHLGKTYDAAARTVTTWCGQALKVEQLELLNGPQGSVCEACLRHSPGNGASPEPLIAVTLPQGGGQVYTPAGSDAPESGPAGGQA